MIIIVLTFKVLRDPSQIAYKIKDVDINLSRRRNYANLGIKFTEFSHVCGIELHKCGLNFTMWLQSVLYSSDNNEADFYFYSSIIIHHIYSTYINKRHIFYYY